MAEERPLYTLYKNLKAQNYDVPEDYDKFESALTRDGKAGADNRHAVYENLKAQNYDVPDNYERFYSALFEPRNKDSSKAKGGSVPMSAKDKARFMASAQNISNSAKQTVNNAGRYNKLKQRKQKQQSDFGRVKLGTNRTPFANEDNVVKDDALNTYITSDNEETYNLGEAQERQAALDEYGKNYQQAVDTGEIPSILDVRDKNGNYDLQENIGKDGTYLTEEGVQAQFDRKLADVYARKKEIEDDIAEEHKQNGNPLLSYSATLGGGNGRTREQQKYLVDLVTARALVDKQIGALEAVKQYPTSSWGKDAWKALDNTAFNANTWDFGITDFATMGRMEGIKAKMDYDLPLTASEKTLLNSKIGADAASALEDEKMGNVYRWTKIAGQSLPFMLDFYLTGGFGGVTKALGKAGIKYAAKRGMGTLGKNVLKYTGVTAGNIIGSYAMAGTEQALKTGADIMQRHMGNLYVDENGNYAFGTFDDNGNLIHEGGEAFGTALYKGMTSAMVENYTEKFFHHTHFKRFLGKKMAGTKLGGWLSGVGNKGWYASSKRIMKKFGVDGFGEEVMEEEIGIPLHALLDGENKFSDLGDLDQQLDIIGGMALSVGGMAFVTGGGHAAAKGAYRRGQYYRYKHKVDAADAIAQQALGENWAAWKDKIDNATNEDMKHVLADVVRSKDTMSKEQMKAATEYAKNLMIMRGYNLASTMQMDAKEMTNEPTTPEEEKEQKIDDAYSEGHEAEGADTHEIQIDQADKQRSLAELLGITEQQLSAMSSEELDAFTGQNDNLDRAIYEYQLSNAKYQGVIDNANDKVDMEAQRAASMTDMITDKSRGTVRNATIKATQGANDYGVYIINGNIATHDDGTIDISGSDQMIIYYDPQTEKVEHADASRFAALGDENPAEEVKAQAVADAKEKAIRDVSGIIDGRVEVGTQFNVTGADGIQHTYEVLADNGDGTAMVTLDGNVEQNPYSFEDLQNMKDMEDKKLLEAAKQQRAEMEAQREQKKADEEQRQEQNENHQRALYNNLLDDDGKVVMGTVHDGKHDDQQAFIVGVNQSNKKPYVVFLNEDGTFTKPRSFNNDQVEIGESVDFETFKAMMPEIAVEDADNTTSSAVVDNGGESAVNENEQNVTTAEENAPTEQVAVPSFEDSTPIPVDAEGEVDLSQTDAAHAAEWYDNNLGEDAGDYLSGEISKAKNTLSKAQSIKVKGNKPSELVASKQAKEAAIADAQARLESAISIRDAYNERQLAKEEGTPESRKNLIEKAKAKFARLKNKEDWKNQTGALWNETVGKVLHRLYDGLGVNVFDHEPQTVEEYVSSSIAPYSLNYEGTETSKGVKQETGLQRKDFAKSHVLAAEGKGVTVDDFVHKLWDNRPSQFESVSDQEIRNALLDLITSDMNAYDMQHVIENNRIAQAEKEIEDEKNAADNAKLSDESASSNTENEEESAAADSEQSFPDKLRQPSQEGTTEVPDDATDEKPLGEQKSEDELPFSAKDENKQDTPEERAASVEKNRVDDKDMDLVDTIIGKKMRKSLARIAKMMGAKIQYQYTDKLGNGWYDDKTNTIYLTLDSSLTKGVQFIFGHEMTHEIKTANPAAYDELRQLVKDMMGEDEFNALTEATRKKYNDAGVMYSEGTPAYEEEVVADQLGKWLQDLNYAHTLAMKMSHPLLAKLHEIINRIRMAFHGTEYTDTAKMIMRSIEQAYVQTANREAVNAATQEGEGGQRFSIRTKEAPKKTQKVFKLMRLNPVEEGKLFPLFIGSGEAVELGKWYDADSPKLQDLKSLSSKDFVGTRTVTKDGKKVKEEYNYGAYLVNNETGEAMSLADFKAKYAKEFARMGNNPNVKAVNWATDNGYRWIKIEEKNQGQSRYGGENRSYYNYGINGSGSVSTFAMRPGWHAGSLPTMRQIGKGKGKDLRDDNFVWVEGEIPADIDYNEEAQRNADKDIPDHIPTDGFYLKATNANKEASQADKVGWYVASAFKPNRIMSDKETRDVIDRWNAEHPGDDKVEYDWKRESGKDFNAETMRLEDTPKFSIKTWHGSQANFDHFDHSFMGSGEGAQAFGWGTYVSESEGVAKSYAIQNSSKQGNKYYYQGKRLYSSDGVTYDVAKYMSISDCSAEKAIQDTISMKKGKMELYEDDALGKLMKRKLSNDIERLESFNPADFTVQKASRNLYDVEIPDDTGNNYLDWDKPLTDEQQKNIYQALYDLPKDQLEKMAKGDALFRNLLYEIVKNIDKETAVPVLVSSNTITQKTFMDEYDTPNTGATAYHRLTDWMGGKKEASQFLSKAGFTGIKVIANHNAGGNKEGKMNYVIFDENDAKIVDHTKFSLKDTIKPIGKNQFGDVYDQFSNKPKDAFDFLLKNKSGYLKGVFHRDEIGDIDLAYGDAPNPYKGKGLAHIIRKHVETLKDFSSVDEAINTITDVISNGAVKNGSILNTFDIEKDNYRVVVAADKNGNWVLTAFDYVNPVKKKKKGTATALPLSQSSDGAGAVAPNLSAAKIDNSSETAKKNGEKFSLKDDKTMFGMHNISIDKLRKAIKQGGFAAPSMGVIDSKNGIYSGYGEITLIPKAEKIAKRTGRNIGTYAADAWTPIYPPVEKKFGGNGGDVAYNDIESVPKEMQSLIRNAIDGFMDGRDANSLAYLYLHEKGKAPELVRVEGKYPKELHEEVKSILGKSDGIYGTTDEQKKKLLDLFIREVYDGNKEEFDNDIKNFIKKDEEFIKKRPNSNISKNKQLDVDWMKEHGYDYGALSRFADGILRDAEASGKVDTNATIRAAQQYISKNGLKNDYYLWKEKLNDRYQVEEVIFAGYKADGNRKYLPNTVENAVKVMKQDGKNASVGSASFSHFVASILKPMGTLDQIRKKKGNLTGNYEDVEKFLEKWQPVYDELADKMQPGAGAFENYGMDRLEEAATQKNPKKYAKDEYGVDLTDEDIKKLNELIEAVKNDKPSIYFETKFMRPYGLDEFEKAIVPKDAPKDVVDALKKAGIDVHAYEGKEDREKVTMDAVNNSEGIRFSLKDTKPERIEKLRQSKPVEITGKEITPSDDLKQYKKNALEYGKTLRGTYTNEDTGEVIDLTGGNKRGGIREILQHDYKDIEHLQSIAAIPQILEKSVFIDELPNEDKQHYPDVKSFRYYVCGLKIDGKDYTMKAVVAEQNNGNRYYDHRLTDIEKGKLLSIIPTIQKAGIDGNLPKSAYKDKRLISILQENRKENAEKFSLKDEQEHEFYAKRYGTEAEYIAKYDEAMQTGNVHLGQWAMANIRKAYRINHSDMKFSMFAKMFDSVKKELYSRYGNLDELQKQYKEEVMAARNMMEAARKKAEEEEAKKQKHLEELSLLSDDELDKRYMDAIGKNDEATARETLDEAARRKGYGDVTSEYQGEGAWAAPSNPRYDTDEERRADIDNSPDVNLEDMALGYSLQPDDYFDNPRAYMNNTAHGLESAGNIKNAINALKRGEKDVKVKVYRAVPTSVKEGKLRNGDWVTPSRKYAEMHGNNRFEGKYRIIEDEVPANQLWWDGNDANEFGFDDGKEYKYKNVKNNRKLNDLVTRDDKGNIILPSKRFNSRKSDIRFSLVGEQGATAADDEDRVTTRMDNLQIAQAMEKEKKDAKAIKLATGWERGADGRWRYEIPDFQFNYDKWKDKNKEVRDGMSDKDFRSLKRYTNDFYEDMSPVRKRNFDELRRRTGYKIEEELTLGDVLDGKGAKNLFKYYPELRDVKFEYAYLGAYTIGSFDPETNTIKVNQSFMYNPRMTRLNLLHEVQHAIQRIEGFARGGSENAVRNDMNKKLDEVTKQIKQLKAEGKTDEAKVLIDKNKGLYNAYANEKDDFKNYQALAGEVEARNVQTRMGMADEERRNSLASETEDVAREDQIFLGQDDGYTKFSIKRFGTDIANASDRIKNLMDNEKIISRRIGSRAQAQNRVLDTLSRASSEYRRANQASAKSGQDTWEKDRALGHVIQASYGTGAFLTEEELGDILGEKVGKGNENYVYRSKDGKTVFKLNNLLMVDKEFRFNEFLDRIKAHNEFAPEDMYTPIGFALNEEGDFCVVLEQPYVQDSLPATQEEIDDYMEEHGYDLCPIRVSADEVGAGWSNGEFEIWDTKPRNVLKDKNGDLHFIDTVIQHTFIDGHNDKMRFSLRVDQYQHDLAQWKKDNNLPKDAERPSIPVREPNETAVDFAKRVKEYRKQMALWMTAPQYEDHLLTSDTAQGQFNLELQRGSVLARIALQDSMLAVRKAQEAIMKEVGVDRLNIAEDAYTAENRSHGKGKNEFEEYNDEFLQPLRKSYNKMMKSLGNSYDNVKVYMMAKHGLERNAHIAFKKALDNDFEKQEERVNAYNAYKADMDRMANNIDFENGKIDFTTWRRKDNAIRAKYAPSYLEYRYDKMGITQDYSGLSALFEGSDFEEAAAELVKDVETRFVGDTNELWHNTNAATKKILRDSYKAGMMTKDVYEFVRGMYDHYIPLRGWGDTNADQVWNYMGGGKGAFNQTLKKANGRKSLADDPIAYIENMAESGILMNNKNWVKQHLLLLAENHPTSLLNVSKAWYIKTVDAQGNEEWIPASPNITANMTSQQVRNELEAFEKKMEQMKQKGDATQKREHLEISYPQTMGEEREHEVRVMRDGEEYVIYVNGDPQLAQAMNNTRAHRVRQGLENSISQKVLAWMGRKMAAAYTSLSPLFIPSNYLRDFTMTLASTAIREDARYNYLLRKNMATHWNTFPLVLKFQNGTLREKVRDGTATKTEQMFYDYMMNGGETGFVSVLDVEDMKKKFKNELKDMNRMAANPKKIGHVIMDSIETLNRAIEDSNRFMVYMTSIQYGRSIDEAVNDAKDVTLNFNRKGTGEHGWQTVRNLYLFINPAVQSLQTLGALAKHHPFKFTAVTTAWIASGMLVPMINNLMMEMFGGDDDKDKYWSFTKWDRRNNLIMWVPGTHNFIKIPLAQEFRFFYGVGDMIASKLYGGEKAQQSWEEYGMDMLGQVVDLLPLDPTGYDGNIAVSLMPNPIRPVFELAFNVDFTGKPIFKDSEYNKYDPNFTKAYVGTPDWLVRISRMVNSVGNDYPDFQQNAFDKFGNPRFSINNPAVVDHVLSSYLGGAYTMGSQILGVATKALNDGEIKMADVPLFSKFVSNPDDRPASKKQGDEFWATKERHARAARLLSQLKKKAKVDGDYSTLDVFFGSDEYKQYLLDDKVVKKYEEDRKKERAEESGDEYKPHKTTHADIYKSHATPKDDFEDLKLSQLYNKVKDYNATWKAMLDMASSQADSYYDENVTAIQAAWKAEKIIGQMNDIKKKFLSDKGEDAWNAEGMEKVRDLRKQAIPVLEKVNKVLVERQKAKANKK